jgi:ATP-dependent DNA ligase
MYAAGVRGGFSPEFRQVLLQHFEQLRIARWPFAHLPERTEARGAKVSRRENGPVAWLDPFIVVRIEFLEWTPENRLCHPRFAGMRSDKDAREVTFKGYFLGRLMQRPAAAAVAKCISTALPPRMLRFLNFL